MSVRARGEEKVPPFFLKKNISFALAELEGIFYNLLLQEAGFHALGHQKGTVLSDKAGC